MASRTELFFSKFNEIGGIEVYSVFTYCQEPPLILPIHTTCPVTYWVVCIAAAILVLVLLATLSTQIRKVINTNPLNGSKVEQIFNAQY